MMKEKIKIIILIVVFILSLIAINNILNEENKKIVQDLMENNVIQNNISYMGNNNVYNQIYNKGDKNMGKVLEVTSENFEDEVLKSNQTVLIDFYADWCGPCQMMSPIVEDAANELSDVKVVKVNVDNAVEIAGKYQIMSIPTLVVIKNGEVTKKSVGVISKSEIIDLIK